MKKLIAKKSQKIVFSKFYYIYILSNFRNNFDPLDDNFAIENKIKEISAKIQKMYENFVCLEKSLEFIESLENKKFAEDEKMKLLNKMNDMQKKIEALEDTVYSQKEIIRNHQQQVKPSHAKKLSNVSGKHERTHSNLSNTKILNDKNGMLHNINENEFDDDDEGNEFEKEINPDKKFS